MRVRANGAGKSTLLRLLAGVTRPTRGRVEWAGEGRAFVPERFRATGARAVIGYRVLLAARSRAALAPAAAWLFVLTGVYAYRPNDVGAPARAALRGRHPVAALGTLASARTIARPGVAIAIAAVPLFDLLAARRTA